ncbi:DUF3881 family protein [Lachnospiraceae bacterium 62-35]
MHKHLRSVGFSSLKNEKEVEKLIQNIVDYSIDRRRIQLDENTNFCEIRGEVAPGMGIAVYGEMDSNGTFHKEYYYPYMKSDDMSSKAECTIQRHVEKETYAGLLEEYKVGISLIFFMDNLFEYREMLKDHMQGKVEGVRLTGLSSEGKILLPLKRTAKQIEISRVAARDRDSLIEAAKNGDEDAIETLTIEDIDTYSQISKRVKNEDLYSIIDTCFMPCGVECDQYAVIGNIKEVELKNNRITGEEVYDLTLECSDLIFHVGIAKSDMLGEPKIGRRFKGEIWMQGIIEFEA